MTAPKTTRTARKAPAKAATKPTETAATPKPEVDLSALAAKAPSAVNVAEAAWLITCAGLDVSAEQMALAAKMVQLVAGSAHRAWQKSAAAEELHGKKAAS